MSTQNPSFHTEGSGAGEHVAPEPSKPTAGVLGDGLVVLRGQAQEIIDEVLADVSGGDEALAEHLRERVAAHPGCPEKALREHLAVLRPELAGKAGAQVRGSGRRVGRARLEEVLRGRMLVTAFQPIDDLLAGSVVGAEALTRFVSDGADYAVDWFAEAEDTGLRTDLEFAALESALTAALELPSDIFVAVKLSQAACLDERLAVLLDEASLAPERMVLELSGYCAPGQAALLETALAPLRKAGVRLAIDHSGSYFASVHRLLGLRPEMIKLDAGLITGIDQDSIAQELVAAELGFAHRIGAVLVAQHIETEAELATLTGLGLTLGQGYHLGRPTVKPQDWASWQKTAGSLVPATHHGSTIQS